MPGSRPPAGKPCLSFFIRVWYNSPSRKEARYGLPLPAVRSGRNAAPQRQEHIALRLCGLGVAMGNAVPAVKAAADLVIGTNDEDGIAQWLEAAYR